MAAHLGLAMLLLGLLIYIVRVTRGVRPVEGGPRLLAVVATAAVLCTIVAGGYMAGTQNYGRADYQLGDGAHHACGKEFPSCNGEFMPFGEARLVDIHLTHRFFMYLASILVIALVVVSLRRRVAVRYAWALAALLGVQVLVGALNVWLDEYELLILAAPRAGHAVVGHLAGDDPGALTRARALAAARRGGGGVTEAIAVRGGWRTVVADYFDLCKPKVQSLLLFTTVTTMYVAGDPSLGLVALTCLGGALSAGGAGAINHALDRDLDRLMKRTADRPVASGRISPTAAIVFGVLLGCASFALLALTVNPLAAVLSMSGLLGYVLVYTMWLKRTTPQNIVIGGAAGAVPPLVAWAAVTGELSGTPLYLFAIVFFWTPPHFWSLSLLMKDEYARAGVPMLPVVRGEAETRRQILLYTVLLYAVSQLPFCAGAFGVTYLVCSVALGAIFIFGAWRLLRRPERRTALRLYLFSLAYLALLFGAMVVDTRLA